MSPLGTHLGILAQSVTPAYPLDDYPGAEAAYSLRELSSAWEGLAVVRVRRTGDNAESDFTAAELTDGTLDTWVAAGGAGEGRVTTWYDQSGNGKDAVQTVSAAAQPYITSGGTINLQEGTPSIDFSAGNVYLEHSDGTYNPQPNSVSVVFSINNTGTQIIYDGAGAVSANRQQLWFASNLMYMYAGGSVLSAAHTLTTSVQYAFSLWNGASSEGWINGVSKITGNAGSNNFEIVSIGTDFNTNPYLDGQIKELIIWNSDQSANRTGIESNITEHYGL